ncbi:hypothetical protein CUR178_08151 [Leishmania enriettii]|uniref:Uncharacterized protein n=1 Tax=Leishmania enriettii TaxID=5663 RepID=A0A836H7B4_LEIEN|nr:hypothetical protein CUR178_08151 [Leishmania enriettii]
MVSKMLTSFSNLEMREKQSGDVGPCAPHSHLSSHGWQPTIMKSRRTFHKGKASGQTVATGGPSGGVSSRRLTRISPCNADRHRMYNTGPMAPDKSVAHALVTPSFAVQPLAERLCFADCPSSVLSA